MGPGSYFTTPDRLNLACGHLQYAPVWKDTLQLNYARTEVQKAMMDELRSIARRCDGVRCDTAMAVLKDSDAVIGLERTYGVQDRLMCVVNLSERDSATPFETDAFVYVRDYREVRLLSTETHRSPQFDLWPGGITLRLRAHEGLVFCFPSNPGTSCFSPS
jgi:hypothetical protein